MEKVNYLSGAAMLENSFNLGTNTPAETGQVQFALPPKLNPKEGKIPK